MSTLSHLHPCIGSFWYLRNREKGDSKDWKITYLLKRRSLRLTLFLSQVQNQWILKISDFWWHRFMIWKSREVNEEICFLVSKHESNSLNSLYYYHARQWWQVLETRTDRDGSENGNRHFKPQELSIQGLPQFWTETKEWFNQWLGNEKHDSQVNPGYFFMFVPGK